jgi:hypothetical protein
MIDRFKISFLEKTGRAVIVQVAGLKNLAISRPELPRIKFLVEQFIPKHLAITSIAITSRKREIVTLKQIFCKIARDYGYSLQLIGEHVYPNGSHPDVIYSNQRATDLIEVDTDFRDLYVSILNKIQDDFRTDQSPPEKQSDS